MAKMNRRQLRQMILKEMGNPLNPSYGMGMGQQRAIADRATFPAADHVIDGLLSVLDKAPPTAFETDQARDAILGLQGVRSAEELMSALANIENLIADALRAK